MDLRCGSGLRDATMSEVNPVPAGGFLSCGPRLSGPQDERSASVSSMPERAPRDFGFTGAFSRREGDDLAVDDTTLRVLANCPTCGAEIPIEATEPALLCAHCALSHLVLRKSAVPVLVVPFEAPDRDDLERTLGDLGNVTVKTFLAPYVHVVGRLYEGVVGIAGDGTRRALAVVKTVEVSRPAFDPALSLPAMGALSYLSGLRPFSPKEKALPRLPLEGRPDLFATHRERLQRVHLVEGLAPDVRLTGFFLVARHVVLRPFHLVAAERDGASSWHLLDGRSRTRLATLSAPAAEALEAAATDRAPLATKAPFAFRPMRCPNCGARLPLEGTGQVRFCESCGRALRVHGKKLGTVRYRVETSERSARETIYLPFWRFPFAILDPRDGAALTSLRALGERLGGAKAHGNGPEPLDVPAFRPEDRRKTTPRVQPLFALAPPGNGELVDGPARAEYGFSSPQRFVAILEEEAASLARLTLLLRLGEKDLARATPPRLRAFLRDAPLTLGTPQLVLRAYRPTDVPPAVVRPAGQRAPDPS